MKEHYLYISFGYNCCAEMLKLPQSVDNALCTPAFVKDKILPGPWVTFRGFLVFCFVYLQS